MPEPWQRTSPLGVLFFFTKAIKRLIGNTLQMVTSAGAVVVFLRSDRMGLAGLVLAAIVVLLVVTAILRYWFFRFSLDDEGLRIRQGVFKKTHLDIQFDRVQGMDVEQSLVYRLLGLATVTFDTAGSAAREGQIPAVSRDFANALRQRIEQRPKPASAPVAGRAKGSAVLVKLDAADMVRIGLTDRSVLIGLAIIPAFYQAYDDALEALATRAFAMVSQEFAELGLAAGLLVAAGLGVVGLVVLAVVTVASAFLRFHDFELFQDGSAFRSRAGLLTRKEIVVESAKVQQLRVDQGVVMRLLQRCRLRMLPASSGAASGNSTPVGAQTLHVPLLDLELLGDLRRRVFGDEGTLLQLRPDHDGFIAISPLYMRARLLAVGVLPAILVAGALVPLLGSGALLALVWPLLVGLVAWQTWRRRGYRYDDDGLVSRSGLIGFSIDAFLFRKVQGATVSRSPLQRRNDLASLTVHLASGHVTVPYIDYATACRLRDYMLFKVESSRLPWH